MNKKKIIPSNILCVILLGIIFIALVIILIVWGLTRETSPEIVDAPVISEPDNVVVYQEVENFVEVEKTITSEILADGLNDMGLLITQQYFFTEVVEYESAKTLFGTDFVIPFTKSNFLASYDGEILAGVDFTGISVDKNEDNATITVTMPSSEITSVSIDNDSLVVYSESEGVGNPISISDYNTSLAEMKHTASQKAVGKGILEKADENAKVLITNFIGSLVDLSEFTLEFITEQ